MECHCDQDGTEDAVPGWWLSSSNVQMGAFTLVGYLLYRFSQTLPALIRWPIRIFCSLTGLSTLWGWVSRLMGTLRGIQTLFKWLSRIWRFIVGLSKSKRLTAVIQAITGSPSEGTLESNSSIREEGLRMILLGPAGAGRTSLAQTLLGKCESTEQMGPLTESTQRGQVINGVQIRAIDTPDLLGTSMGNNKRAMEALRSLQLARPGPHAFLLVVRASGSSINQDVAQEIQTTIELFGDGVTEYVIPVLTHADCLPHRRRTIDKLLEANSAALKTATSLCNQRPELVDNGPDCPPDVRSVTRRQLLERVAEMSTRGYFVHGLQRKEDHMREELLADMSSALATKLGNK
eukprot:XP_011603316.1 PREDICTED: putative protein PHLOEM PROTEIN 2-LIKE A3 isoform X1 [Takifugu rubripes]